MEEYAQGYRYDGDDPSSSCDDGEPAGLGDGAAGSDPTAGGRSGGMDYRRLIDEQRFELEELKKAARDASPSSSSRCPPEQASPTASIDPMAAVPPPAEASDVESQRPPPPPPASMNNAHMINRGVRGRSGVGSGLENSRQSLEKMAAGRGGDYYGVGTIGGARLPGGAGEDGGRRYSRVGVLGGNFLAAVTRETRRRNSVAGGDTDDQTGTQAAPTTSVRFESLRGASGASGDRTALRRPFGARTSSGDSSGDSGRAEVDAAGVGASAIADEALASLEWRHRSAGGGVAARGPDGARRREPPDSSTTADASASTARHGARPRGSGVGDSGVGVGSGSSVDVSASGDKETSGIRFYDDGEEDDAPPPLEAAPTATKVTPLPSTAVERGCQSSTLFTAESTETVADGGCGGRDSAVDSAGHHRDPRHADTTGFTDLHSGGNAREKILAGRPFVGSSWAASGGGWGGDSDLYRGGGSASREGRVGGGDAFRSASWADKLVVKREEQSVLVKQLERELASTVSALKDERKDRRDQTEALKRRLDKATGSLGDREAELERRERMTTTLMAELEALRSRCDRLSASREERAEEADKMVARLREDNRELEARLRQADAAAAEAREGRAGADAERVRMERELHLSLAKVTSAERRVEETAEASTAAAEIAARDLQQSKTECEGLRSELESLRRRLEDEESAGLIGSLRAQVADLERLLETGNQRCVALEARLGLLEKELIEAEGGEVEARAKLRWALGQLGETLPAVDTAPGAAGDAPGDDEGTGTTAPDEAHRGGSRTSGRARAGGLEDPGCRVSDPTPAGEYLPAHCPSSPSGRATRLTRGALTTPPSGGKAFDDGVGDGKRSAISPGGNGSGGGGGDDDEFEEAEEAVEAEEAEEQQEKGFREPNWRSMVPVLFPPGWRDREIGAAAAVARKGARGGADAAAVADEGGDREEASAERSARGVRHSRPALGWDSRHQATGEDEDDASSSDARDHVGGEREVRVPEEEADDSFDEAVPTGFTTAVGARERRRRTGAEGEVREGSPSIDDSGEGVYYDTSEGRVQATLDHLTAEEQRFAFEGGVETEFGEWRDAEDDELEDGFSAEEGRLAEESRQVPRYGYGDASDYDHDGGGVGDTISSPAPGRGGIAALRRSSRKYSHRNPSVRAGEARRRVSSPEATVGLPHVSGRGAVVSRGPPSQVGVRGARGGANGTVVTNATDRTRSRSGRLTQRSSAGEWSTGVGGHQEESYVRHGMHRGAGVRAAAERSGGITRRRLSAGVPAIAPPAATKLAPKTRAGRPPSHPRSTADASALFQHPQRRDLSNPQGVQLAGVAPRRRGAEGAAAGNLRGRGGVGGPRLGADVSRGGALTKQRAGRSVPVRTSSGTMSGRSAGGSSYGAGMGRSAEPRRHRREDEDGQLHASMRGLSSRVQNGGGTRGSMRRRKSTSAVEAAGGRADAGTSASYASGRVRVGSSTAREHVSLMRRRKERGGLGSSFASRAGAGGGSERQVGRRGAGGSNAGTADSSICSSRVWKP